MESPPTASPPVTAPPSKMRVFFSRLSSTLVLWGVMILTIVLQDPHLYVGVACFFGIAGTFEYFRLLGRDAQHMWFSALGMLIGLGYWAAVLWHVFATNTEPPLGFDLAALVVALQGSFLLCYRHGLEGEATLRRVFSTVFGVVYTVVCYGFIVRLMYFRGDGTGLNGAYLMLFLILVTKFSDMGAYAVGSLLGRHKMIPHISPAKTWEGLLGAIFFSTLGTVLMLWWKPTQLAPLTWTHGFVLVPILVFCAVTGDLAESILKRCTSIKDTGHKFPGIGGILDLTDSLLFTAPVFYYYLVGVAGK